MPIHHLILPPDYKGAIFRKQMNMNINSKKEILLIINTWEIRRIKLKIIRH